MLKGIDFDVMPSKVSVVIGPSGSGKSTLLRCCNGLETADGGTIRICGQTLIDGGRMLPEAALNNLRCQVGMVFQSFNLFPHLSVMGNITIAPRKLRGHSAAAAEAAARRTRGPAETDKPHRSANGHETLRPPRRPCRRMSRLQS